MAMRKRSKSKATIDKADRALQDWYRRECPDKKCEICGAPFQLLHHHILKSKSNHLRFNEKNLIFICSSCHFKLHHGYPNLSAVYASKRGKEWVDWIEKEARARRLPYRKKELEEIIERYSA